MMLQHLKARLATAVTCAIVLISTSAFAQSLPAGWSTSDIGDVDATGSASGGGSSFTGTRAGADIWFDRSAWPECL